MSCRCCCRSAAVRAIDNSNFFCCLSPLPPPPQAHHHHHHHFTITLLASIIFSFKSYDLAWVFGYLFTTNTLCPAFTDLSARLYLSLSLPLPLSPSRILFPKSTLSFRFTVSLPIEERRHFALFELKKIYPLRLLLLL